MLREAVDSRRDGGVGFPAVGSVARSAPQMVIGIGGASVELIVAQSHKFRQFRLFQHQDVASLGIAVGGKSLRAHALRQQRECRWIGGGFFSHVALLYQSVGEVEHCQTHISEHVAVHLVEIRLVVGRGFVKSAPQEVVHHIVVCTVAVARSDTCVAVLSEWCKLDCKTGLRQIR